MFRVGSFVSALAAAGLLVSACQPAAAPAPTSVPAAAAKPTEAPKPAAPAAAKPTAAAKPAAGAAATTAPATAPKPAAPMATTAPAAAGSQRKVTIIFPTKSAASWPMFLAKDGGYYARYGLDVDLQFLVFPADVAAVTSRQAVMDNLGADSALLAASRDGSLTVVGASLNKGSFGLVAGKQYKDIKELAGKKFAVGRIGDPPYHYTTAMFKEAGVDPSTIQWVSTGADVSARVAALQGGQVDASLLTSPSYFSLEAAGFPVLATLAQFENIFISTYYLMRTDTVTNEPALVENIVKAQAEGIKRFYDDKETAVTSLMKYAEIRNRQDAERVYDQFAQGRLLEPIPYILKQSVEQSVERNAADQPAIKNFDFTRVVNNKIVDKLVTEGFFEQVFGAAIREEQQKKKSQAFGL